MESRDDILVIGQIISDKIEIIATSKNHHVLISFLTSFSNEFKELILTREIVNAPDHIFDLECESCGGILPYFPKRGREIECPKCNYKQMVW